MQMLESGSRFTAGQRRRLIPLSGAVFIVTNQRANRIKLLYCDRDGYVTSHSCCSYTTTGCESRRRMYTSPDRHCRFLRTDPNRSSPTKAITLALGSGMTFIPSELVNLF